MKLLQAPYHTAVRRSLRAFPTSPVKCMLAEAGLPSIIERRDLLTWRLIPKLINTSNKMLFNTFHIASSHKRNFSTKSTIRRCISYSKELEIQTPLRCNQISRNAPWLLPPSSVMEHLRTYSKEHTSNKCFKLLFTELFNKRHMINWTPIFTDGSKTDHSTSFAVVHQSGSLITAGWLPLYCSIYTAEAVAVLQASEFALKNKGKFVICTDNLSVLSAIKNVYNDNPIINQIRDNLIKNQKKLLILWVPGHKGISGNELADKAAKDVVLSPSLTFNASPNKDLQKLINRHLHNKKITEWSQFQSLYSTTINRNCTKAHYPAELSKKELTYFTRLRLGHTFLTHSHLLQRDFPPSCPFCLNRLTMPHILDDCPKLTAIREKHFSNNKPSTLLHEINIVNIRKIFEYINIIKLNGKI